MFRNILRLNVIWGTLLDHPFNALNIKCERLFLFGDVRAFSSLCETWVSTCVMLTWDPPSGELFWWIPSAIIRGFNRVSYIYEWRESELIHMKVQCELKQTHTVQTYRNYMNKTPNYILKASDNKSTSWHCEAQNTQAIIWISYDGITIGMGLAHMHWAHLLLSPSLLANMQLDKRVFDKALGTHTLPFQSGFHNRKAQLHRPTLTKLYRTEPLIPLQHGESHPARPLATSSLFPPLSHGI